MEPNERLERLRHLPPAKRRLLLKLLQEGAERTDAGQSIPRCADRGRAPLSFAQQRLWFLERLVPGTPAYNLPFAVSLEGRLDPVVLERCLKEVFRRHEVLRACFVEDGEEVLQVFDASSEIRLPLIDLCSIPEPAKRAQALRIEEARRPFDLCRGPLVRMFLLRLQPEEHWAFFTMHHAVSDGWSISVLIREISALYHAYAAGQPSPLSELPIQYADYAVWQRRRLQNEILENQLSYWRRQLADAPAVLDLPTDRPRPPLPSFRGAVRALRFDEQLTAALEHLGRRAEATLFMTLLAGLQVILSRHSRQTDVLIGSPIAGRTRPELEALIGFFANTLVLRTDLSDDPSFLALLERVKGATLEAFDHQELPFEKLVDALGLTRDLSHSPLFQVTFALQNVPAGSLAGSLRLRPVGGDTGGTKFDLSLSLGPAGRALRGSLQYSTDLFDVTTIDRLIGHLQTFLEAAAATPERRLSDIGLLSTGELHQLSTEWGGLRESFPGHLSLHQLLAEQARQRPDATALTCGSDALSYRELDRRANGLAHRLLAQGVKQGCSVGLCTERSLGLVVGILGILKAGCTYLPLDPSLPRERLSFLMSDAKVPAVVAEPGAAESLPVHGRPLVWIDDSLQAERDSDPGLVMDGDWPAYVIFTSGSTGRPKGVVVTHGNVLRLFRATERWFDFGPSDVWTLFHSYAFDFSVWEIWGALLYGGRLVVVPYWVSRAPESVRDLLRRERVTVLSQTPSAFRQLLQALGGEEMPALRWVVFGGEALEPRTLSPWWTGQRVERGGRSAGLINMYGITETTVHVTFRRLSQEDAESGSGSLIGTPIPDMSVLLLDAAGEPIPIGVSGEMYVGGAGVALGYMGRPELTAQRFVPDPFSDRPGQRLYRSGDLARWRARGELEYLGRSDQQVKVRGFRVELGEIEAELCGHSAVREAVVLAREEALGERRLVAYVVPAREERLSVDELRRFLLDRLPEHMVPAMFVLLATLPLTPNGKVDRAALPVPETARPDLETGYAPPRNITEEILCAIWSQVLHVDQVGIHDNFFVLGGDSILSLRIVALAGERGLEIALPDLFRHQTVAELADGLSLSSAARSHPATEPFSLLSTADRSRLPEGLEDAYPLSRLQAGMLYHMALTPDYPLYHNVDSWHIQGRFEAEPFREAGRRVTRRHPMLRTSFDLTGYSEPLQLVHRHVVMPVEVEDIRALPETVQEQRIAELVAREKRQLFAFSQAPQLRFIVHLRSETSFQLTLVENHAIFDGWSLHATLAEIFELYFALLAGEAPPEEPPLPLTYREFIHLEQQALASEEARSFWQEMLSGGPAATLPSWFAPTEPPAGAAGIIKRSIFLPPEVLIGLESLARIAAVPMKSVLLAAHLKVLAGVSGQQDVVTGLVSNGRMEEPGGDQVRGLFLNTLPFRLRLGTGSWVDLAQRAFLAERKMLPYRRFPLAELQRQRITGSMEVGFNFIHFHVVRNLLESGRIKVLSGRLAEGGNLKLQAHFSRTLQSEELRLHLEYDPQWVSRERVEKLAEVYLRVLSAAAAAPRELHDAVCLLPTVEEHRLLREWQNSADASPTGRGIHALVKEQAIRNPDAIALVFGDRHLSFAELDAGAGRLARRLRRLGVGPEVPVGLCAERSPEMVIAMLGILQAGGAYLSLDPAYPKERLAFMLEDAFAQIAAPVLLTQRDIVGRLPGDGAFARSTFLWLDERLEENGEGGDLPESAAESQLAYLVYTSGSTGRPKAVAVSHLGLPNLAAAQGKAFDVGLGDRVLQFASPSFDASVSEVWVTLAAGATLILAPRETLLPGPEMLACLRRESVTHATLPPAALALLPDSPLPALRTLVVAGEACPPDLARRWATGRRMVNAYGPTETTVCATLAIRDRGAVDVFPIGRPIDGFRAYLLGEDLHPVPTGAAGELYIGGIGLARGYRSQPGVTAERFVPDPLGTLGDRLYRTGDLARFLPCGEIEFLGRIDGQLKVRGIRIEPGEIEAVLASHPAVQSAAVVARDDQPGGRRLVAYVVAAGGAEVSPGELRDLARRRLPDFMIPSVLIFLDALPTAPGGKVDRRALASLSLEDRSGVAPASLPETDLEKLVAEIWSEVLGTSQVGLHDNFFDLGGHSLVLVQVQRKLYERLAREVPAVDLLRAPTVSSLARLLSGESGAEEAAKLGDERAETRREKRDRRRERRESRAGNRDAASEEM
jgi:amino acid adenylation domain-containing protein